MSDILARVNETLRDQDIQFARHDSFDGFADLDIDRGGYEIYPGFTPEISPDGLWIEARMHGRPIATMAAQPIVLADTLTSHLETEGLYPSTTDRWELYGDARAVCDAVTDFTVFTGGYLIAPDMRGSATSRLLLRVFPKLTRELARLRWMPEHFFFTVKADMRWLGEKYAPETLAEGMRWYRDGKLLDDDERLVGYMSAGFVEKGASELLRAV